jgi:hypothetical protein
MSENEQNDKEREKKKSDKDIPLDDLPLVDSAGVRQEELKEIWVCPTCHMVFPSHQSLAEHFSIYHGQNQ